MAQERLDDKEGMLKSPRVEKVQPEDDKEPTHRRKGNPLRSLLPPRFANAAAWVASKGLHAPSRSGEALAAAAVAVPALPLEDSGVLARVSSGERRRKPLRPVKSI